MRVEQIMTKDPATVSPDATVREAAQLMKREDVGIIPVIDNLDKRQLVGVITDRDIAIRCVADGKDGTCRVRDVMSDDQIATCQPGDDVDDVMGAMTREKVRRIPIVDERGSLVGIVAQADLVRRAPDEGKVEDTIEQVSEPGR
jgi:CBS domain-containing protein